MAKFDWGRALSSAGSSLQNYYAQREAERRRQAEIDDRRAWQMKLIEDQRAYGEQQDAAARARQNAENPFMLAPGGLYEGYGLEPPAPVATAGVPGIGSVPVPSSGQMMRRDDLFSLMSRMPQEGAAKARPTGKQRVVDVGGVQVLQDEMTDGQDTYWDRGAQQFPSQSVGSGGSAAGMKPAWFDPYSNPRYDEMTEADKLYYMINHGFQTSGAMAGGKQDWNTIQIAPAEVKDVDAYRDGKFYDTKPGWVRDSELKDDEVRQKFEDYIASSDDPDMAYASIVRRLKAMGADTDAIRRVLPEYHGLTFDDIRARASARSQQAAPGAQAQYPQALIDEAAKSGMRVGEYQGQIGAWDGAKFYPWEGE